MNLDLTGKVVLVTGASRGIGYAITSYLLNSGATVAAHYNNNGESLMELKEKYSHCYAFGANLSDSEECIQLFQKVKNQLGKVDVLINNAGVALSSELEKDTNEWISDWDFTFSVNMKAVGLLCREAINHFGEKKDGIIINISSRAAFRGDTADFLAYAASKGGVVALTRSIARAFGKKGITAFNIAPGFVKTDMAQQFIDEYGEEFALSDISLNKLTEPNDIAPLVVFLSSGMAKHATGGTFDVNAASYVH